MTVTDLPLTEPRRLRCALFVDFDNVYLGLQRLDRKAAEAFATDPGHWLAELGTGTDQDGPFARRFLVLACYLNPAAFSQYRPYFTRAGFQVVDCPSLTQQGKSSADINLVLDAVDALAASTRYEEFVIVSADADFTPLAQRCRAADRRVSIITASPAASAYRAVADTVVGADAFVELVTTTNGLADDEPTAVGASAAAEALTTAPVPRTTEEPAGAAAPATADKPTRKASAGATTKATTATKHAAAAAAVTPAPAPAPAAAAASSPTSPAVAPAAPAVAAVSSSIARRAVRQLVRTAERPLLLSTAAQAAQKADPTLPGSAWGGARSFTAWLARELSELGMTARPPGYVWDPKRFDEDDLPGAVTVKDSSALQRQVVAVTDVPGLSQSDYRQLLTQLAYDIARHPFERAETARRVRDACQKAGAKVGRASVNFVISGILYGDADLAAKPTAAQLAKAWADNVVGLARGARMELSKPDERAIRAWVGGGLLEP